MSPPSPSTPLPSSLPSSSPPLPLPSLPPLPSPPHPTLTDPRVADWFLMQSPLPTLFLITAYLTLVWVGPRWMRNRKPYDLKYILLVYNVGLVALSAHIVYEVCAHACVCVCV